MARVSIFSCYVWLWLIAPSMLAGADAPLPGPGLDVPVDVDGDGDSSYGDRYAFNYWLGAGGELKDALFGAEAGKDGTIDVSKFFSSDRALLAPQSEVAEAESLQALEPGGGGAAAASSSGCLPSAIIVAPFGAPTSPASIFTSCQSALKYPTGADIDPDQDLWISRGPLTGTNGVALLNLRQVPPKGNDGSIPIMSPSISANPGVGAEDIVFRTTPPIINCLTTGVPASPYYSMSTWTNGALICPVTKTPAGATCGTCGWIYTDFGQNKFPLAIDAYRANMPTDFGTPADPIVPEDLIFSDNDVGITELARIRKAHTPGPGGCYATNSKTTLFTFTSGPTDRIWGLALGNFNGAGVFGIYFVSAPVLGGQRSIRRLIKQASGPGYVDAPFASFHSEDSPGPLRSLAFDPVSGDLFVSEDSNSARIWRVGPSGGTLRKFGQSFRKPNGIAFHPSGTMLVVEESSGGPTEGNVLAVGGWRNRFKRGDANGDGTVNVSDPIKISNWLQNQSAANAPACLDGADANDDSKVLQNDAQFILDYLFSGGAAPPFPGPNTCNRDPTADLLDCNVSLGSGCAIQY